jgi:hypothetical protein
MTEKIRLKVPPDQTPEEEAELVAAVAQAIEESGEGVEKIDISLERSEDVSYQAVSRRAHASDRWNR